MEIVGWTNLYMPYVSETYTVDDLVYLFETKYAIGKIKRIDVVRSFKKNVKTAFVHFETWYLNDFTTFLRKQLETRGKYNMNTYLDYLRGKIEEHYDCDACRILYSKNLAEFNAEEVDDLLFLIQRTKYTHTHSTPIIEPIQTDVVPIQDDLRDLVEQHDKRIELLEDEIHVLVKEYRVLTEKRPERIS